MTSHLHDGDLGALLPAHLREDPAFAAAIEAVRQPLRDAARAIPNLLIFARLGGQPPSSMLPPLRRLARAAGGLRPAETALLEQLAWQFHVDFREAARTDAELAGMVLRSIAWHRVKGTPAGMTAALELCGFPGVRIEEDGTGDFWATYQLGLPEVPTEEALRRMVAVAREMQPVRCRLWRVYNDLCDFRPAVWSGGAPDHAWGNAWWSRYSGVGVPGVPGVDADHDLMASFGGRDALLAERYFTGRVGWGMAALLCGLIPYIDRPIWGRTRWSDRHRLQSAFVLGQLLSTRSDPSRPRWRMAYRAWAKSQAVLAWPGPAPGSAPDTMSDRPAPSSLWGRDGVWGEINSNYGVPCVRRISGPAPRWSEGRWSEDAPRVEVLRILEQFHAALAARGERLAPGGPDGLMPGAGMAALISGLIPYIDRPFWGRTRWSEALPRRHGFSGASGFGTVSGQRREEPAGWTGRWIDAPWRRTRGWERTQPAWRMFHSHWARSQAAWGWTDAGPDNGPNGGGRDGVWGDINSTYGVPCAVLSGKPPRWSEGRWSDAAPGRTVVRIRRQCRDSLSLTAARVLESGRIQPGTGVGGLCGVQAARPRDRRWEGPWAARPWLRWPVYGRVTGVPLWSELHEILHVRMPGVTRPPANLFGSAA